MGSAVIGVLGSTVVLIGHTPLFSLVSFAVVGYGTSVLVPLIFSATGQAGGADTARVVARTTTFICAGILIGPALVGWLGQIVGFTATFACFIPLLVAVAAGARSMATEAGPVRTVQLNRLPPPSTRTGTSMRPSQPQPASTVGPDATRGPATAS